MENKLRLKVVKDTENKMCYMYTDDNETFEKISKKTEKNDDVKCFLVKDINNIDLKNVTKMLKSTN